jgi:hypothetical protein
MQKVLRDLSAKNVKLSELITLEMFGYTGKYHTKDYARLVKSLAVWEINPAYEESLKKNLPEANITIADSFKELNKTSRKYNFIVIDNNVGLMGESYEHFRAFPGLFRITMDSCIILINVVPTLNEELCKDKNHLLEREQFYETPNPENIPLDKIVSTYQKLINKAGYALEWYFLQDRRKFLQKSNVVYYLVMKIKKQYTV